MAGKKQLIILPGQEQLTSSKDSSIEELENNSSLKSLGSFRLRFRSGSTVKDKPLQEPSREPAPEPPELEKEPPPSVPQVVENPLRAEPEPEVKIVDIPRARLSEIDNYELQEEVMNLLNTKAGKTEYSIAFTHSKITEHSLMIQ